MKWPEIIFNRDSLDEKKEYRKERKRNRAREHQSKRPKFDANKEICMQ